MNYKAEFKGWEHLTQIDLIVAYRKAKADCFYEDGFPSAVAFAEFEGDLLGNLDLLLNEWQQNKGPKKLSSYVGQHRLVPKKISVVPKNGNSNGHIHFANKAKAFEYACRFNSLVPDFRIVGEFPVKTHILSALWINMVGHKFDACLNDNDVYGARLKRLKSSDDNADDSLPFHISSIGSFKSYYGPYQKWRSDGLTAIRSELKEKRPVVAVSLDLKSFYHSIDPNFITTVDFQEEIGLKDDRALSPEERQFTKDLISLYKLWGKSSEVFSEGLMTVVEAIPSGLAIGLTASRIISNVLLCKWDKLVREELTPIHYGRYVDDMFLVLHDGGKIHDTDSFMAFISERLTFKSGNQTKKVLVNTKKSEFWSINFPKKYFKETQIRFQASKQKLFILEGSAGFDLIDSIQSEMNKLSSEHRLMPSVDMFDNSTAAKVLIASENSSDSADTLRRADGLSLHRLSWSIQLRQVETLARDLSPKSWVKERQEFYQFSYDHILCPDKILNHYTYLPRLLSLAISLGDWSEANKIVSVTFEAIAKLIESMEADKGEAVINGISGEKLSTNAWNAFYTSLIYSFIECAAKAYPEEYKSEATNKKVKKLADTFMDSLLKKISFDDVLFSNYLDQGFYEVSPKLQRSDLAKAPYKSLKHYEVYSRSDAGHSKIIKDQQDLISSLVHSDFINEKHLIKFLAKTQQSRFSVKNKLSYENIYPFVFPTRAYNSSELVELLPECIGKGTKKNSRPEMLLAKYITALRGTWVSPDLLESISTKVIPSKKIKVGSKNANNVLVAISSLGTTEACWQKSASNQPDHSLKRYNQLCELINSVIASKPKPDYLFLPEFSLPLKWVDSISNRLMGAGINLVAGTEFRHGPFNKLKSEACLVLQDDRLGFGHWAKIWQPKIEPAPSEDEALTKIYGKSWLPIKAVDKTKPVYVHNGFHFGVMVCSELLNSKARIAFQGEVDALAVLAWNRDLATFSTLIESTALDVHAYTILVNNRVYGDSRVRSPAKESFRRDLARVQGGENDFFVTVKVDITKLRKFQSRAKRWTNDKDPFKPVPEGFVISKSRRVLPAK